MCVSWNAKQLELDAIKHIFDAIIVYLPYFPPYLPLTSPPFIHSSFSNTSRQDERELFFFASSRIELLLYTQKKNLFFSYYVGYTTAILQLFSFSYQVIVQMNNFSLCKTPKLLQLIIFFFVYRYTRTLQPSQYTYTHM